MGNEKLRAAIKEAGLEPEQLADLVEVDIRTVERWLAGRTPYPRLRNRVARALSREEHELWPEVATAPEAEADNGREIQGSWASDDDPGAPDWRELLEETIEQLDLLDYSLLDLLASDRTTELLAAKAGAGCRIRILIAAPDSVWVRARASALGQREEDHIGRSPLELEIETARGYLEPLTRIDAIGLYQLYVDPGYRILRFDQEMLLSPHLYGIPARNTPLIHLSRQRDDGLFDQFAAHLEALARVAGEPIESAPELYPDPRTHPDRYKPLTAATNDKLTEHRKHDREDALRGGRPIEQVRAELRRPTEPTGPAPQ